MKALGKCAAFLLLAAAADAASAAEVTISTEVEGRVANDEAVVRLSISREGKTAAETQKKLLSAVNPGLSAIRAVVPEGKGVIESGRVATSPRYAKAAAGEASRIVSWVSRQAVTVRLCDTSLSGPLLTAASGSFEFSGMRFSLSKKALEAEETRLIGEAVKSLNAKAAAAAKSLAAEGRVETVSVKFGDAAKSSGSPVVLRSAKAASNDAAPEPAAGETTVRLSATAVYKMGNR